MVILPLPWETFSDVGFKPGLGDGKGDPVFGEGGRRAEHTFGLEAGKQSLISLKGCEKASGRRWLKSREISVLMGDKDLNGQVIREEEGRWC